MNNPESNFRTPQEEFWAGSFGDEYIGRNTAEQFLAPNIALFAKILGRSGKVENVIEFGANIGLNLEAITTLLPAADLHAVEINPNACRELSERLPHVSVHQQSILEFEQSQTFDLVLIKGVLIHINPDELPKVYAKLAKSSSKYVVIAEYYNPVPVAISYRGHEDRLFKRDFAGEFLDLNPEFKVIDYGFAWHRDPVFPQGDTTWFLLERG